MEDSSDEAVPEFPLIPSSESINGFKGIENKEALELETSSNTIIINAEELKKQLQLAGPLVIVGFLQYSIQMISAVFLGHLGELSLSSATMATSFAGVTGYYFIVSFILNLSSLHNFLVSFCVELKFAIFSLLTATTTITTDDRLPYRWTPLLTTH
ncbi:Protein DETOXIFICATION 17 [Camellia lanceoleosa]|nr:Protein DETOXIFICATION 17 [Camellia lanceoleosa]